MYFGSGIICALLFDSTVSLKITNFKVPRVVEQGRTIELSCEFEYSEEEREDLDVKWYFRDSRIPFLQWVPSSGRQPYVMMDKFKGRTEHTLKFMDKGKGIYLR